AASVVEPLLAYPSDQFDRDHVPHWNDPRHPVNRSVAYTYFKDPGTPEKYLQAHYDLLAGAVHGVRYEAPWIAPTADVEHGATLGSRSTVGAEARVAAGATVEDSVLHPGAAVGAGAVVRASIVGPGAKVGAEANVTRCVLGAGAIVPDGTTIADAKVATDQTATAS